MKNMKLKNKCRRIREWLYTTVSKRFNPEADWLQNHIVNCPRCRRRLVSCGKVNIALSFMKTQPHCLDLLMRANTQAIGVLKHSLRQAPKARKLKLILPEPKLLERCSKYGHSVVNMAACLTIMLLMKTGVCSSMDIFHTRGQKVFMQYYTKQVGEDLANEIFINDTKPQSPANSRDITKT